ncbi:Asp/Glu racemase [Xylophilus rhododendri]|uniref:Asp/Glu racemase n=1 Tax=Xylophilus rhododendri TaxID=2697032 RepID=A0A857J6R9_9BURK|nr:aspartate/glutamate racemase family protein [Xylophilus rhododendri]QHI98505.1 Asp/Glu racemase [Xylophilus rhododendri]
MKTPRIQVLNPNSSVNVTEGIDRAVQAAVTATPCRFESVTSRVGPPGIVSQADYDIASVQVAEHVQAHQGEADAFVIACFSDPGVAQARAVSGGKPVIGIGEAGVRAALAQGRRVGVVAVADASIPRHMRYWKALGLEQSVAGERALNLRVDQTGDPDLAFAPMLEAARQLRDVDGADVILLGCAGMADLRKPLADALGLPVIDPCEAAAQEASRQAGA